MKKTFTFFALFFIAIINIQSQVIVTITNHSDVSCYSFNDGWAKATASGGSGTYIYKWNTNPIQTTDSAINLSAGTFILTVTDFYNNQDSSIVSILINQPSLLDLSVVVTAITCNGICNGTAYVNYEGGTPPYSIHWSANANNQITQLADSLCAGYDSVKITDSHGCELFQNFDVFQPPPLTIQMIYIQHIPCYGQSNGRIIITPYGGMAGYSYIWNNGSTTQNLINVPAGNYCVTVTDNNGCTHDTCFNVSQPPQLFVNTTSNNGTCNGLCNGYIVPNVIGGQQPYTYLWSNFDANSIAANLCPGTYRVTVTDFNSCQVVGFDTVFSIYITGKPIICYEELDTIVVSSGCGNYPLTYSWNQGIETDSFIVVSPIVNTLYTVTITDALNQISIDSFFVTVNPHCGNIISGYVFIDLNENGIKDNNESGIANKLIKIIPGPSYAITDSIGFYISHTAGMYNYSITIPNPGYFTLIPTSNIAVFTTLGNTDSLNNFAFQPIPVNDLSISVFDDAANPGFDYYVTINCFNNGADTLNTILKLKFSNLLNYQSSLPNISSQNNDTLIWNINNFLPHSYITFYAYFNIPTNILIGDTILLKAIILPVSSDTLLSNNSFNITRIVTGSYDPNYKSVTPDKYISLLQVQQRKPLFYTIHFQNTGTDTAYTVRVTDTVSTNLDIESFEMLFASHPYSVQIKSNNILEWKFENILLPDSNVNEPLSHGFVHFSLIPKEDLLVNDIILNSSNIYFDFNTPIITNTVIDTVCETLTQIKNSNNTSNNMVIVYPNPFNDKTNIILNLEKQSLTEINLFSAIGQKINSIYKGVLLQGTNKIILKNNFNLTKGFYLLEVKTETQVYYQKLYIY